MAPNGRCTAILTSPADDQDLLRALTSIFTDRAERRLVRDAAYLALARAVGRDWEELPSSGRYLHESDFDEQILEEAGRAASTRGRHRKWSPYRAEYCEREEIVRLGGPSSHRASGPLTPGASQGAREGDAPLTARAFALRKALLLEFEEPVEYEGLEWRFAIATIRYVEELFERLVSGQSATDGGGRIA